MPNSSERLKDGTSLPPVQETLGESGFTQGELYQFQDGAEYDRRGNRLKYQKPGYNLDRRSYEVNDASDRLEQQVPLRPWLLYQSF